MTDLEKLRRFAQRVMENWPEGGIDGGGLQEIAIECGLLMAKDPPPTSPCGDNCTCADVVDADEWAEGVLCYRRTALLDDPQERRGSEFAHLIYP